MPDSPFHELFGSEPEVRSSAPGRVNLIGEHTDYNGGYVLPTVISHETQVELRRRNDRVMRAWSLDIGGEPIEYTLGREQPRGHWVDYLQGITWSLAVSGYRLSGSDVRVQSDIPIGGGLSSSAALGVSMIRALSRACSFPIDPVGTASLVQRSENEFVGAPVGILDPFACSLGAPGKALFIDTRNLEYEPIPIPSGVELIVIHSGVSHAHAFGQYSIRRQECEQAAALLGVTQLRDVPAECIESAIATLPAPLGKRVRHVVTENNRVLGAVDALQRGDFAALGELFYASHRSLRDDFEVSIPELDLLVGVARLQSDIYGGRMTGGGFGGSVVMLARQGTAADVGEWIAAEYQTRSGRVPRLLVPERRERPESNEVRVCR